MGATETKVTTIPACDFCKVEGFLVEAAYDGKTRGGPWAWMCNRHFKLVGVGLGVGKGQKLIKE